MVILLQPFKVGFCVWIYSASCCTTFAPQSAFLILLETKAPTSHAVKREAWLTAWMACERFCSIICSMAAKSLFCSVEITSKDFPISIDFEICCKDNTKNRHTQMYADFLFVCGWLYLTTCPIAL